MTTNGPPEYATLYASKACVPEKKLQSDGMNASKIAIELGKIASKLAKLAEQLEAVSVPADVETDAGDVQECWACREAIDPLERVVMDMHERCYRKLDRWLKEQKIDKEEAIRTGLLPQKKTPGRKPDPPLPAVKDILEAKRRQEEKAKPDPKSQASKPPAKQ